MDDGGSKIVPYVDGSTKEDISKWFDFVFYTKTITKDDGTREYKWITANSEMYNHAKDRTQLLPEEMDQDDLTSLLSKLEDLLDDIKPDSDEDKKEDPEQYKT